MIACVMMTLPPMCLPRIRTDSHRQPDPGRRAVAACFSSVWHSAAPECCQPHGQVALEKSQGNLGAAVEALRKYVDIFQTDCEAWEELGALYLQARARALAPLARCRR